MKYHRTIYLVGITCTISVVYLGESNVINIKYELCQLGKSNTTANLLLLLFSVQSDDRWRKKDYKTFKLRERRNVKEKKLCFFYCDEKNVRSKANSQGSYESELLQGGEAIKRIELKEKNSSAWHLYVWNLVNMCSLSTILKVSCCGNGAFFSIVFCLFWRQVVCFAVILLQPQMPFASDFGLQFMSRMFHMIFKAFHLKALYMLLHISHTALLLFFLSRTPHRLAFV